ncbi:MAG: cytochrome c peroxidase [Thauera sp.]
MGGSDNLKTLIGGKCQQGPINSPTVLNSSPAVAQFWDGRAADLAPSPTRAKWPSPTTWRSVPCAPFRTTWPRSSKAR